MKNINVNLTTQIYELAFDFANFIASSRSKLLTRMLAFKLEKVSLGSFILKNDLNDPKAMPQNNAVTPTFTTMLITDTIPTADIQGLTTKKRVPNPENAMPRNPNKNTHTDLKDS